MQNKMQKKMTQLTEKLGFKLALFSAAMMTFLGPTLITPALPQISKNFASTPHIELLTGLSLTIPALAMIFFTPLAGIIMDKYKKLSILYPMMILWSVAGVSGAFCESIYTLLLSRFVLGFAGAFITTGANALVGDYFDTQRRQKALSLQGFVMAFGSCLLTDVGRVFDEFFLALCFLCLWGWNFYHHFLSFLSF